MHYIYQILLSICRVRTALMFEAVLLSHKKCPLFLPENCYIQSKITLWQKKYLQIACYVSSPLGEIPIVRFCHYKPPEQWNHGGVVTPEKETKILVKGVRGNMGLIRRKIEIEYYVWPHYDSSPRYAICIVVDILNFDFFSPFFSEYAKIVWVWVQNVFNNSKICKQKGLEQRIKNLMITLNCNVHVCKEVSALPKKLNFGNYQMNVMVSQTT